MNDLITPTCPHFTGSVASFPTCEKLVCAWVQQPGNTYSNIGFYLVGFYLIYLFFKKRSSSGLVFGISALFIGVGSTLAHSMRTPFFGFLDFAAIFSIFTIYAIYNFSYSIPHRLKNKLASFLIIYPILFSALYIFNTGKVKEIAFGVFVIALLVSEYRILRAENKIFLDGYMKKLLIMFGIGVFFVTLDMNKIGCNPDNHYFQFHMLWHLSMATCIYLLCKHIDQHRVLSKK